MSGRPTGARGPRSGGRIRVCAALLLGLVLAGGAAAQGGPPGGPSAPATAGPAFQVRSTLRPPAAALGERVVYQGWVHRPGAPGRARWLPPDTSATFTWGEPRAWRRDGTRRRSVDAAARHELRGRDSLFVEVPLQVFAVGRLTVPGIRVELDDGRGPRIHRLPGVTLDIVPVLTAADSNADYRELHGPLAAPWWERVPWRWVVLGLLAAAAVVALVVAWRRRRRRAAAPDAPAGAPEPAAEALAALAALRALHLPEHGRYAEHAFRLGRILRRFLETTTGVARPGDTTPELVAHLRGAGLAADDLARFSGLLRVWDRVKFAREPFTLEEALRAERAVEAYLRRPAAGERRVA